MPGGQGLADLLSGAAGAPVNRGQLNAFVANSQATNGLRSAQTDEALLNAQRAQDEQVASGQLEDAFVKSGARPADAHLMAVAARMHAGSAVNAMDMFKAYNSTILGDPSKLNTPDQTAAAQAISGKLEGPQALPNQFSLPTGVNPPAAGQSPQGAAQVADTQSQTNLRNAQAAAGGFNPNTGGSHQQLDPVMAQEAAEFIRQNPNLAGNFRSLLSNGGPDVIHAFLHPQGAPTTPANGITPAPGVSLKEQSGIRNDFANGTAAKQTTSLNTMVLHSQLFDAIADQLGNGNFAPTNYINQLWQRTFGSPVPSNLQIAGDFLGREAVRATINAGAGTGAERELAVTNSSSPDALHGAASTLRSLAAGQLHSLDLRAQRGGVDIAQLLGPEAQAAFGRRAAAVAAPHAAPEGGSNTSTGLPSYPDEASAMAAGHKAGDRVIIGGVTGTLQ
jgi:hypothetical protein